MDISLRQQSMEKARNALTARINQLDVLQGAFLVGPLSGKSNVTQEKVSIGFTLLLTAALALYTPDLVKYTIPENAASSWQNRKLLDAGLPEVHLMTYAAYFGVILYLVLYAILQIRRFRSIQLSRQCYSTLEGYKNKLNNMKNSMETTLSSIEKSITNGNIKIEPLEKIDQKIKILNSETNQLIRIDKSALAVLVRGVYWCTSVFVVILMIFLRGERFLKPITSTLKMDEMLAVMSCCVVVIYLAINVKLYNERKGLGLGSYFLSLGSVPAGVLATIAVIGLVYAVIAIAQLAVALVVLVLVLLVIAGIMWAIFNG